MRVSQFLADQHVAYETILHAPAFTAQKRAKYLGIPGRQVAKSVLLSGPTGYLLAVLSATCHVDTRRLEQALGGPIRVADDREMAEVFSDCEWGVAPPFGTLYGLETLLDDGIPRDTVLVFEAQTHQEAIRLSCADFESLERPRRLAFAHAD